MKVIACAWIPVPRAARDPNLVQALALANRVIVDRGLDVLQIETVNERGWFGRRPQTVGLRIWHRVFATQAAAPAKLSLPAEKLENERAPKDQCLIARMEQQLRSQTESATPEKAPLLRDW